MLLGKLDYRKVNVCFNLLNQQSSMKCFIFKFVIFLFPRSLAAQVCQLSIWDPSSPHHPEASASVHETEKSLDPSAFTLIHLAQRSCHILANCNYFHMENILSVMILNSLQRCVNGREHIEIESTNVQIMEGISRLLLLLIFSFHSLSFS